MASRLEDKNAKLHALEDENNALKRNAAMQMQMHGGGAAAASAELDRVKSKAAAEASVANEKVEGFARERNALKTILESKIATLVEGIKAWIGSDKIQAALRREEYEEEEGEDGEAGEGPDEGNV